MDIQFIPHIATPESAPWVYWVMLLLLLCAAAAEMLKSGLIRNSFATLFTVKERSYDDGQGNLLARVMLWIFRAGTLAMGLNLYCYTTGAYTLANYGRILAIVCVVLLLRALVILLVDYTFQLKQYFSALHTHYSALLTAACCCTYPVLLLVIQIDAHRLVCILLTIIAVLYVGLSYAKWLIIFRPGIRSVVYIAIYSLTLEVLPLLGLVACTKHILY